MKNKKWIFKELWERLPIEIRTAMKNTEQDPVWHPEGSFYTHTNLVFNIVNDKYGSDNDLLLVAIFHDLGKPETQRIRSRDKTFKGDVLTLPLAKQKISNIGHEYKAEKYIDEYFHLFSDVSTDIEKIKSICLHHLRTHLFVNNVMTNKNKRKKFEELEYFDDLIKFEDCDANSADFYLNDKD